MFSHRVPSDHSTNRLSAAIEERRARGAPLLDLTESNPTRCGFHYDEPGILGALASPGGLLYEPHPQGLAAARKAVAGYYAEAGCTVDPESIFLTTGTSEAYTQVFKLLADPGDEILVPTPGYPLLDVLTGLEAVTLVHYLLRYDEHTGWSIDLERLRASVSTRTRAIVVVSPNNPTGSYLKQGELDECNELCRQFGLALIVDEVFSDYGLGGGHAGGTEDARVRTAAGNDGALTFTMNGFSKLVGLPQVKMGWIRVSGPRPLASLACERLAFVTDAFLSVSAAVQHAAPAIFRMRANVQEQINHRLEENGRTLEGSLSRVPGARVLQREGGWYAILRVADDVSDDDVAVGLLEDEGVLVHPGYFYDFPGGSFLVLSLLPPAAVFREGAEKLGARLRRLGT
jgi:aspartate/methionine/tyrosine aminotransferase